MPGYFESDFGECELGIKGLKPPQIDGLIFNVRSGERQSKFNFI